MPTSSPGATDNDPASAPANNDRDRWNKKYREASPETWATPDPFLLRAFSQYILPIFPQGGHALDLAGGAGRHSIWLAKQGWEVTLIDVSEIAVEQARQNAAPVAPHIHFVVDDLTHYKASQTRFDLAIVFFFLNRNIFPEIIKSLRPGGFLIYKTHTQSTHPDRCPNASADKMNPSYLLHPGELRRLAAGLDILHHREVAAKKSTAELIARKK
jgi:SAM-dependent methyltransferase